MRLQINQQDKFVRRIFNKSDWNNGSGVQGSASVRLLMFTCLQEK